MKYNTLTGEITGTPEEIVEFLKKYKQEEYSQINIPFVQQPQPCPSWTITCTNDEQRYINYNDLINY